MRVRLKADGRIVEILADGSEGPLPATVPVAAPPIAPDVAGVSAASYAREVRGRTQLSQSEFARRIGVPVETVRNWEQGKRSPRGPARALLKLVDSAPDRAFAALRQATADR
jgi:putative transcriptional regulator